MPNTIKTPIEIFDFWRFLKARSLKRTCKVDLWKPCRGLEGLSIATSRACLLQCGFVRANLSPRGPMSAPRLAQDGFQMRLSCCSGFSWAHLGLPWAPLGPSWGVQGGILWQISGVQGGQTPRCEKHQKTCGKSTCLADSWRQQAFRTLAKLLFGRCGGGWVGSSVDVVYSKVDVVVVVVGSTKVDVVVVVGWGLLK